jgi:hypothetical protein
MSPHFQWDNKSGDESIRQKHRKKQNYIKIPDSVCSSLEIVVNRKVQYPSCIFSSGLSGIQYSRHNMPESMIPKEQKNRFYNYHAALDTCSCKVLKSGKASRVLILTHASNYIDGLYFKVHMFHSEKKSMTILLYCVNLTRQAREWVF